MEDAIKHVISKDGSSTLFSPRFDQHYHSIHGAVQESMHVFIEAGLAQIQASELSILEMGFGTGLNALLTALEAGARHIRYTTLEAYPLSEAQWRQLNYAEVLGKGAQEILEKIHQAPWREMYGLSEHFSLKKVQQKLEDFTSTESYDLVYFDAFAPSAQAELWTLEIFQQIFSMLNPGAILVTYCAKGDVRRAMIAAGFTVEKIPGPPGKREMLRGRCPSR